MPRRQLHLAVWRERKAEGDRTLRLDQELEKRDYTQPGYRTRDSRHFAPDHAAQRKREEDKNGERPEQPLSGHAAEFHGLLLDGVSLCRLGCFAMRWNMGGKSSFLNAKGRYARAPIAGRKMTTAIQKMRWGRLNGWVRILEMMQARTANQTRQRARMTVPFQRAD